MRRQMTLRGNHVSDTHVKLSINTKAFVQAYRDAHRVKRSIFTRIVGIGEIQMKQVMNVSFKMLVR